MRFIQKELRKEELRMLNILNHKKCKDTNADDELHRAKMEREQAKSKAKSLMSKKQFKNCNAAIHVTSAINTVVGAAPIPGVDAVPISIAQILMIARIGYVFGKKIPISVAKGMIGAAGATLLGRTLVKIIPGVGWVVSGAVAGIVTETIGWIVAADLASGGKMYHEVCHNNTENENMAEDAADAEENEIKQSLQKRAQVFLSGEKDKNEFRTEYNELLNDFESILNSLASDDTIRKLYDDLYKL